MSTQCGLSLQRSTGYGMQTNTGTLPRCGNLASFPTYPNSCNLRLLHDNSSSAIYIHLSIIIFASSIDKYHSHRTSRHPRISFRTPLPCLSRPSSRALPGLSMVAGCRSAGGCSGGISAGPSYTPVAVPPRSTDPKVIAERNERVQRFIDKKSRAKTKAKFILVKVRLIKAKV